MEMAEITAVMRKIEVLYTTHTHTWHAEPISTFPPSARQRASSGASVVMAGRWRASGDDVAIFRNVAAGQLKLHPLLCVVSQLHFMRERARRCEVKACHRLK
jgi:hypothetical protein